MANISKIKLPNVTDPYQLVDNTALHSSDINNTVTSTSTTQVGSANAVKTAYDKASEANTTATTASSLATQTNNSLKNNTYSFLTYKDNTHTAAQIKALTSAKVGDFYIASDSGAAYVCIKAVSGTASESSWEETGSSIDVSNLVTAYDSTSEVVEPVSVHTIDEFVLKVDVVNNLTSTSTDVPLSAAQGKVLNDSISSIETTAEEANTKATSAETTVNALSSDVSAAQNDISSLQSGKLAISGGTMTGVLTAQNNTSYTTKQVRNIFISTNSPSGGTSGDIWIQYTS